MDNKLTPQYREAFMRQCDLNDARIMQDIAAARAARPSVIDRCSVYVPWFFLSVHHGR